MDGKPVGLEKLAEEHREFLAKMRERLGLDPAHARPVLTLIKGGKDA